VSCAFCADAAVVIVETSFWNRPQKGMGRRGKLRRTVTRRVCEKHAQAIFGRLAPGEEWAA
jgi:hypothetical protein